MTPQWQLWRAEVAAGPRAAVPVRLGPCGFRPFPPSPPPRARPLAGAQLLSRLSLLAQCISPGVVETQFAFKLHDKDPEKAAATYEHMKVGPSEATHCLNEGRGALAFRPRPSSQPVASPGGWGGGTWMLERTSLVGGGPPW